MKELLLKLKTEALEEIKNSKNLKNLNDLEIKYLGRKGAITQLLKGIKDLSNAEKPIIGKLANEIKTELESAFRQKSNAMEGKNISKTSGQFFDITEPGPKKEIGHIHPLFQIQYEVEKIFSSMGFAIADGPEAESEYYNFEGLNIPKDHPARDMQDTFFLKNKPHEFHGRLVLRTHTSPVQVRTMEKYGAPLRIIVPGRVFRYEATDASHDSTFYQVEGLLIDKNVSLGDLKGVITEFLSRLFKKDVTVRFRPGYFPFVEPGLEVDFSCLICGGKGCRVCKHTGWMEFMGAGMVHPNVLKSGGIDSKEYRGWAFGFGLSRLLMMRYEVDDIRLIHSGDLRFVEQF